MEMNSRAVGAGPAGPAVAGPIFGQLTHAKMPSLVGCSNVTLKGPRMTAVIHKIYVGAEGKHILSPEESLSRSVSFGKLYAHN